MGETWVLLIFKFFWVKDISLKSYEKDICRREGPFWDTCNVPYLRWLEESNREVRTSEKGFLLDTIPVKVQVIRTRKYGTHVGGRLPHPRPNFFLHYWKVGVSGPWMDMLNFTFLCLWPPYGEGNFTPFVINSQLSSASKQKIQCEWVSPRRQFNLRNPSILRPVPSLRCLRVTRKVRNY